ncbi:hypothetical protein [Deinococcus multiflagellatus]|uniref:MarR family transcriptional regulator n=1 Tax=Deinococcus multiflagellatus TaxID=1656887 RepID=A0ABW1ZQM7_9DEIO|nr:hypothetical protein [Deinococcus multiflagellatus]MBZ9715781.1 hypothetical protein [Deinococcus multiflagellatus]
MSHDPKTKPGRLERQVLQALADAGGTSDTAQLHPLVKVRKSDILRVLNLALKRKYVIRADHPDRFIYGRPRFQFTLTEAGRARLRDPDETSTPDESRAP